MKELTFTALSLTTPLAQAAPVSPPALNVAYVQAYLDSDVAWYDAHLTPDSLVVCGDGSFHDKGSLLAAAAHPVTRVTRHKLPS